MTITRYLAIFLLSANISIANDAEWDKVRFRNLPQGQYKISSGTGFFISNNVIVTNYHVIQNCYNISARGAIPPTPLEIIGANPKYDIALLKSPVNPTYLPAIRNNIDDIKIGDTAFVMGYPLEHGETGLYELVTVNINYLDKKNIENPTEFSISSINHGNSGGPLIDGNGKIIGIVQGKLTRFVDNKQIDAQGIAIRVEILESMLDYLHIPYYKNDSHGMYVNYKPDQYAKNYIVNIHCVQP